MSLGSIIIGVQMTAARQQPREVLVRISVSLMSVAGATNFSATGQCQ